MIPGAAVNDEAKSCEHVRRVPVYIKRIGNFRVDRSEWENEHGALLCYRDEHCAFAADPGHRYCPRHEIEAAAEAR